MSNFKIQGGAKAPCPPSNAHEDMTGENPFTTNIQYLKIPLRLPWALHKSAAHSYR